jgi:hypothetical protein
MNINCKEVAERYLLNQNPLYTFSFPLSLLISIIIFGCAKAFIWSDNSYINQIFIPILALLLSMVIFDIIARQMISKADKEKIISECKSWNNNDKTYFPTENFTSIKENINKLNDEKNLEKKENKVIDEKDKVDFLYAEIPNMQPSSIESKPEGELCIQNSNCCSLCSGSENSNPCNIIAPIPGPQWLPQSAKSVQERLVNENYTKAVCDFR